MRVLNKVVKLNQPMAISAATLLEIAMLVSAAKLKISLEAFLDDIEANPLVRILPLTAAIAKDTAYLTVLADPMDITIVATARVHQLTLLTSDQRIADSGLVKTIT